MTDTWRPFYRIKSGKDGGSGSFLCPPGHPRHHYSLYGYESARHRNEMSIGAIDDALRPDSGASDTIKRQVQKIMDEAVLVPSDRWIKQVYAYFHNSYAPENLDRNVSNAIIHNPAGIVVGATRKALADYFEDPDTLAWVEPGGEGPADAHSYRDGSARPLRAARRGYEVTGKRDGSEVFVYALTDDGTRYGSLPVLERYAEALEANGFTDVRIEEPQNHKEAFVPERVRATNPVPIEPIDPGRHLAVLCVREYFPDHDPRLDLIENPGDGAQPCAKCGEKVQYEARVDKLAKVTTRMDGYGMTHWTYATECSSGGDHDN